MIRHTVTSEENGTVLLAFLKETLGLSHRTLVKLKAKEDGILQNGVRVTVRAVLHTGDEILLHTEDSPSDANPHLLPCKLPLCILWEDEDICVCNKPAGMPTHPSHLHYDDTLANALAYRYRDENYVFRAVNRLDRETSGVVLTARHAPAAARLGSALQAGRIEKNYLALAVGVTEETGEIDLPIRRAEDTIILRKTAPDGEPALTRYTRLATDGENSLLLVTPVTGRTHQIRVHMAALGHPLCGDELYGSACAAIGRCALHAYSLVFPHPRTGERTRVRAPLPEDFLAALSPKLRAAAQKFTAADAEKTNH